MGDLSRLREVAEKATPGPWWVENQNEGEPMEYGPLWTVGSGPHEPGDDDWIIRLDVGHKDDADFIAAFDPNTVKALLRVVEAASDIVKMERGAVVEKTVSPETFKTTMPMLVAALRDALASLEEGDAE